MALLRACHDKVRQFTTLLLRLRDHLREHGADPSAREAATAIRRYFTLAAPLHHQDEDDDLYPALLKLGDAQLASDIATLTAEHASLHALWLTVECWLAEVQVGQVPDVQASEIALFAQRYPAHAAAEETLVYPAADRLDLPTRQALAQAMSRRRST